MGLVNAIIPLLKHQELRKLPTSAPQLPLPQ